MIRYFTRFINFPAAGIREFSEYDAAVAYIAEKNFDAVIETETGDILATYSSISGFKEIFVEK